MSEKVTITIDSDDWDALVQAVRSAAREIGESALRAHDPERHYRLDQAARNYMRLAGRVSALTPEVTA